MGASRKKRILELHYPARRDVVCDLRRRFDQFMSFYPGPREDVEALKVVLSEAATNAICYGSPQGEQSRVRIRFQISGQDLVIEVADQGESFTPKTIQLPEEDEFQPSGRGLWIMEALMDKVEFLPNCPGTCVRMTKRLPPAVAASRSSHGGSVSTPSSTESYSAPMMAGRFSE